MSTGHVAVPGNVRTYSDTQEQDESLKIALPEIQICEDCGKSKPFTSFKRNKRSETGYTRQCTSCYNKCCKKNVEILNCWRCEKSISTTRIDCCRPCYEQLNYFAENMYLYNTPFIPAVCPCGKKFQREWGEKYCPDCRNPCCWRCGKTKLESYIGCCRACYHQLDHYAENIYEFGTYYKPIQCVGCGKDFEYESWGDRYCQSCLTVNERKGIVDVRDREQLIWINLCFPKLCECGCGNRLVDTKRFIKYHSMRKNGKIITSQEYVKISRPNHPSADSNGNVYEHIIVMEEHLNRALTEDERVHHIDENRQNNDISNLLLVTIHTHLGIHARQRARSYYLCPFCNISKSASDFRLTKNGTRRDSLCKQCIDRKKKIRYGMKKREVVLMIKRANKNVEPNKNRS